MNHKQGETAQTPTGYCAYLVRLWQDSPYTAWRASAQSVQSGETVRFADLEQLFVFLREQTTLAAATAVPPVLDDTPGASEITPNVHITPHKRHES